MSAWSSGTSATCSLGVAGAVIAGRVAKAAPAGVSVGLQAGHEVPQRMQWP